MVSPFPVGAATDRLAQRRILLVEDEYLVARYLARGLAERGAEVVGPVARVDGALALIEGSRGDDALDGAILDVTLNDESALPIADRLLEAGVPFVFATGYDRSSLPTRFDGVTLCIKPVQVQELIRALCEAIERAP
jgi:two-component SAPR family response regulator